MKALDFSGMNKIAQSGLETEEERDTLLQAGYTFVKPPDNPFTSAAPQITKGAPFTDHTGSRNYKKLYRIAHDFHQRNNPPEVVRDYWKNHRPGDDDIPEAEAQYWTRAAEDLAETLASGGNDPFLSGLLIAIYSELEGEYKRLREEAVNTPPLS